MDGRDLGPVVEVAPLVHGDDLFALAGQPRSQPRPDEARCAGNDDRVAGSVGRGVSVIFGSHAWYLSPL